MFVVSPLSVPPVPTELVGWRLLVPVWRRGGGGSAVRRHEGTQLRCYPSSPELPTDQTTSCLHQPAQIKADVYLKQNRVVCRLQCEFDRRVNNDCVCVCPPVNLISAHFQNKTEMSRESLVTEC